MDYEKKYKEAQKWIESIYSELSHEQQMEAEAFFPAMKLNRNLEDIRANTVNDCFYCEKDSKDCSICVWRNKI